MSASAASSERTLRRLFLTLFLRGRTSRGLRKESAPKSMGSKLAFTLLLYAAVGFVAFTFRREPVFALAAYLHGMTLVFVGLTVASSAGEVLFNKEEADILLHRPVTSRALLRAKVVVLVQVSFWLAGAFNLAGLFVGVRAGLPRLVFRERDVGKHVAMQRRTRLSGKDAVIFAPRRRLVRRLVDGAIARFAQPTLCCFSTRRARCACQMTRNMGSQMRANHNGWRRIASAPRKKPRDPIASRAAGSFACAA